MKYRTILVLSSLTAGGPALGQTPKGQPQRHVEPPSVSAARLTTEPNWVYVNCRVTSWVEPVEADCDLVNSWLSLPKVSENDVVWLAYLDSLRSGAWSPAVDTACSAESERQPSTPQRKTHQQKVLRACTKKDIRALASLFSIDVCSSIMVPPPVAPDLLVREQRLAKACNPKDVHAILDILKDDANRGSQTCSMRIVPQGAVRFRRLDENTWVNVTQSDYEMFNQPCHITLTSTLWRSSKRDLWNFSDARAASPNSSAQCRAMDIRRDWTWFDHNRFEVPCRYIGP